MKRSLLLETGNVANWYHRCRLSYQRIKCTKKQETLDAGDAMQDHRTLLSPTK